MTSTTMAVTAAESPSMARCGGGGGVAGWPAASPAVQRRRDRSSQRRTVTRDHRNMDIVARRLAKELRRFAFGGGGWMPPSELAPVALLAHEAIEPRELGLLAIGVGARGRRAGRRGRGRSASPGCRRPASRRPRARGSRRRRRRSRAGSARARCARRTRSGRAVDRFLRPRFGRRVLAAADRARRQSAPSPTRAAARLRSSRLNSSIAASGCSAIRKTPNA